MQKPDKSNMRDNAAISPTIFLCVLCIGFACSENEITYPITGDFTPAFKSENIGIATNLEWDERWYTYAYTISDTGFLHDDQGIIMYDYFGKVLYHPYQLVSYAWGYLNSYRSTSDSIYLNLVYRYTGKILKIGDRVHGGIYLPYPMAFRLHEGSNDIIRPPWYSAFTQGIALSLFCRIYEITNDYAMKAAADSLFNTLIFTDSSDQTWATFIDSAGYYWCEDYPFHPPTHVIDAVFPAIFGLYDYYLITADERCAWYFKGACTTVIKYFNDFRVPGEVCYFCLRHKVQYDGYHILITAELRQLYRLTNDSRFSKMADILYHDYH